MLLFIGIMMMLALMAALGVLISVSEIESHQARQLNARPRHGSSPSLTTAKTAVVYFSRSGSTAFVARHIAMRLDAALLELSAPASRLGLPGLLRALYAAYRLKTSAGVPDAPRQTLDLTAVDTLWLGSPIWLYSPAPPIWAFVENNRFDGLHVVLFNTFNSHIADEHIAAFQAKVMLRGAASFEHRSVLRGRMTRQLTPEELLTRVDESWFQRPTTR